jgi:dihydroorotate dehydrogenase electron transfer subunit
VTPVWNDHRAVLVWSDVRGSKGRLRYRAPTLASSLLPGQFLGFRVPGHVLRRPMAAAWASGEEFEIVVTARGEATLEMLQAPLGSVWDVLGPLGLPVPAPAGPAVVVSGGSGSGPCLFLAASLARRGTRVVALHGARDGSESFVLDLYREVGADATYHSEDGSLGTRGFPTDALPGILATDRDATVYAVGPRGLMVAATRVALEHGVPCWVSLEEHMACGVGACLSCVARVDDGNGERQVHVCVDGPVFRGDQVAW